VISQRGPEGAGDSTEVLGVVDADNEAVAGQLANERFRKTRHEDIRHGFGAESPARRTWRWC
jgi:hypothetical protein